MGRTGRWRKRLRGLTQGECSYQDGYPPCDIWYLIHRCAVEKVG